MPAARAHPRRLHRALPLALASLLLTPIAARAQISPPPGPIAPTMKRLDQLEPRRLITSLPGSQAALHVISEPGSYLLTADLTGEPNKHGILITAIGPVSIDLNGFTLTGVQGSLNAVHAVGAELDLAITGSSRDRHRPCTAMVTWGTGLSVIGAGSVDASGLLVRNCATGLQHLDVKHIIHRDIAARSCPQGGIICTGLPTGTDRSVHRFENIDVSDCGGSGISLTGVDGLYEAVLRNVSASRCASSGVNLRTTSPGGGFVESGGVVVVLDGRFSDNGASGLHITLATDSRTSIRCTDITATGNAADGIHIARPGDTLGAMAYIGTCDASSNGASGIRSTNPLYVESSTATNNPLYGLHVSQPNPLYLACHAIGSTFQGNGAANARCARGRYANADCQFSDSPGDGIIMDDGCLLLTDCSITNNRGNGATVRGTLTVTSSNFRRNSGLGVSLAGGSCIGQGMVCELNGGGGTGLPEGGALFTDCSSITLDRCVFNDNTGDGVRCSSGVGPVRWMAPESIASRNTGSGFDLDSCEGAQLVRCSAIGNGAFGVVYRAGCTGGRVEGCAATGNGGGFLIEGTGNLVIGNSSGSGALGGLIIAPGNAAGPVIDAASLATDSNPRANVVY